MTDPDARVILQAVVQRLANASVDPQEKALGPGGWGQSPAAGGPVAGVIPSGKR